ncbi:unnamed protein product [Aphanomyces euteiches]
MVALYFNVLLWFGFTAFRDPGFVPMRYDQLIQAEVDPNRFCTTCLARKPRNVSAKLPPRSINLLVEVTAACAIVASTALITIGFPIELDGCVGCTDAHAQRKQRHHTLDKAPCGACIEKEEPTTITTARDKRTHGDITHRGPQHVSSNFQRCCASSSHGCCGQTAPTDPFNQRLRPLVSAKNDGRNIKGIKDPTIVQVGDTYHVFASTAQASGYNLVYFSFTDFAQANQATFYYLDKTPVGAGYRAAPEVFFFAPQNLWYLVYQNGNAAYSTNKDISNPNGWSAPKNFYSGTPSIISQNIGKGSWVDMFVICDSANCYRTTMATCTAHKRPSPTSPTA